MKVSEELDVVAIVPARGGSKRLPRKNVVPLAGKPLIQWTLDAAKESGDIDLIAVTSDDDEVLEIARKNEGTKLIRRPASLATDTATSVEVVLHALGVLEEQGITAKRLMLLQPTSPNRRPEDIQAAVKRMDETGASSVISVCEMGHSPLWANTLPEDGCMDGFFRPEIQGKRSQDFPPYYRLNGAIYLATCKGFKEFGRFNISPCYAFCMEKERSVDIDDESDFIFADALIRRRLGV